MRRLAILIPVLCLATAAALPRRAGAAEKAGHVYLHLGEEGVLHRMTKEVFEKGGRPGAGTPGGYGEVDWEHLASQLQEGRVQASGSEGLPPARAGRVSVLHLNLDERGRRCRIYVGMSRIKYGWSGISQAKRDLRRAVRDGSGVKIDASADVPMEWILAALRTVRSLDPPLVTFTFPPSCLEDAGLGRALMRFPLRVGEDKEGTGPAVHVLVEKKAPFSPFASLLTVCGKGGASSVEVGASPSRMHEAMGPRESRLSSGMDEETAGIAKAILKALDWLERHQGEDGLWACKDFMKQCGGKRCTGPGSSEEYDVGVSALALRAFLGAGHTPDQGDFQPTVKKALEGLLEVQDEDGCFGETFADGHWIYNHSLATQAVCDALAWAEEDAQLRAAARRAVDFLLSCRNPGAGWRYGRRTGKNDTSCTAVAVAGLKAARSAGLGVPAEAFQGAMNWFDQTTDPQYFKTGYTSAGDTGARLAEAVGKFQPMETMTAAAVSCRIFILGKEGRRNKAVLGGGRLVKGLPPRWDVGDGTIDMYYWYWGSQAMFLLGGAYREEWHDALGRALVPNQNRGGCRAGSWDPAGAWGSAGGRVYATALNALTLEVFFPYRRELRGK